MTVIIIFVVIQTSPQLQIRIKIALKTQINNLVLHSIMGTLSFFEKSKQN